MKVESDDEGEQWSGNVKSNDGEEVEEGAIAGELFSFASSSCFSGSSEEVDNVGGSGLSVSGLGLVESCPSR